MIEHRRKARTLLAGPLATAIALGVLGVVVGGCAPEEESDQEPGVEEPWGDPRADTPPPVAADTHRVPPTPPVQQRDTQRQDTAQVQGPLPPENLRREEGIVGVTGTGVAPVAILRLEGGGSLGLTGDLAREIRRLSGARVRVEGRDAATPVGPGIEVGDYEILEIEGRRPLVGVLQLVEGAWRLVPAGDDEEPVELLGLPERGIQEGMKIWVTGRETEDDRFRVESHGVIVPVS